MTDVLDLVDLAVTDLERNANLGPRRTVRRYAEPDDILPDMCPMLAVWSPGTDYQLIATPDEYAQRHELIVAWYIDNPQGAETGGVGDPKAVRTLQHTVTKLLARIATWASGYPGLDSDTTATIARVERRPTEGSVWEGRIQISIDTAAELA